MTQILHEAEQKLIGILAQDPNAFLETAPKLKSSTFPTPVYQATYAVLQEMYLEGGGPVQLSDLIERVHKRTERPCSVEICRAVEEAVTSQSLSWALDKVVKAAEKRHLKEAMTQMIGEIERTDDVQEVRRRILQVATEAQAVSGKVYSGDQIAEEIILRQEQRRTAKDTLEGPRTGFDLVDVHLGGLKAGRIGLLSGGYGQGKTALALNWLANVAVRQDVPSLFASLEMDRADVDDRLLGIQTGTTIRQIGSGAMTATLYDAVGAIQKAPLYVTDNHPRSITDLAFLVEKHARVNRIEFLVVDYIAELVRDPVRYREDRDERYSRWLQTIRALAKRFHFHALILAQVNYQGQLAESKKMAAHADFYLHIDAEGGQRFLEMRKNRFGPAWRRYAIGYDQQTQQMHEMGLLEKDDGGSG